MSTSSVSDGILNFATQYSIYTGYITFAFGFIGNVLNLLVFTQLKLFRIGLLPVVIASSFSILAYHNVRRIVRRQLPIVRRKLDKQITAMVLMRVIAFVFLVLPFVTYRIYTINFPVSRSVPMAYAIGKLIQAILTSIYIIDYIINFYLFLIFSPRFRRQVKLVLVKKCWQRWKYWCCSINNRIEPDNIPETRNSQIESEENV
ncbi:unnamed protein product [Adineta steineri]|uniref:G-protein coupled receptors family 1 profile domain-containing protein n=1 Tax=Adineta steineri TaxID=433720 RepID=A0A814L0N6_9BILA|nr:unnamed protein product [Adineta steineri]CAF1126030.1 unnamed protein product [Adineta steineri]